MTAPRAKKTRGTSRRGACALPFRTARRAGCALLVVVGMAAGGCSGRGLADDAFAPGSVDAQPEASTCTDAATCDGGAFMVRVPPRDAEKVGLPPAPDAERKASTSDAAAPPSTLPREDALPTPDAASSAPSDAGLVDASSEGASPPVVGCTGRALSFDGTTYATVSRRVQNDFTLEAWIKTTTSTDATSYGYGRPVIYADVSGLSSDFATSIVNETLAFGVGNPDLTIFSSTSVTSGAWIHVAATRRQSTGEMSILINGVLEATGISANRGPLSGPTAITLGANTGRPNFVGLMDEVRIWEVVRTPAQIAATMHQRLSGNEPGLVGYWRFDDDAPEERTARDSSQQEEDADLRGNAIWVTSDALCTSLFAR